MHVRCPSYQACNNWPRLHLQLTSSVSPPIRSEADTQVSDQTILSASDGLRLDNTKDGKLQLLSVNALDTGTYLCLAENSVGRVTAHPSRLIVARKYTILLPKNYNWLKKIISILNSELLFLKILNPQQPTAHPFRLIVACKNVILLPNYYNNK